jgi:hypothetical protein
MLPSRNDPCPCGSGKKYKKCCLSKTSAGLTGQRPSPRFRFEPGSYGGPGRGFVSSALCYEQTAPGQWKEDFCLVNPTGQFPAEGPATAQARADLNEALAAKQAGGGEMGFALVLRDKGYVKLEEFRRAAT